jgi:hypothetical protein
MTTAPVLDPGDFRPTEQDPATLQFQRLERVRSRLRTRRRRRWIILTTLVVILAGAGGIGFSAVRRTLVERAAHAPAPVDALIPAPSGVLDPGPPAVVDPGPPAVVDPGRPAVADPGPPAVADAVISVPSAIVPPPPPVTGTRRDAGRSSPSRSDGRRVPAAAPDERRDADPTAAIDWLLKTPRTNRP